MKNFNNLSNIYSKECENKIREDKDSTLIGSSLILNSENVTNLSQDIPKLTKTSGKLINIGRCNFIINL